MTTGVDTHPGFAVDDGRGALAAMLRARSIALVGASPRAGTLGARMIDEVARSSGERRVHLINPRYDVVADRPCLPSLKHVDEPVDLVLLGVGDAVLEEQLAAAADLGARGAVVFGGAHREGLREALRAIATDAGMALCGAGCMGFVNLADGLRATGYLEQAELPHGPIAVVTHSGSVFSTLLRTRRALGFELVVSSGQELVTTTADYLEYVLDETDARVIALVLETVRDGPKLIAQVQRAAERMPVVLLPIGSSPVGASLVTAHSGALAGSRAGWEALADATGALLVSDLGELTDTLELHAIGRRAPHARGIASVHDSGAERSLVADLAGELGVPFATLSDATLAALTKLLEPGLTAENPLDLWGSGADTREVFGSALRTVAADPAVSAVVLAVDLVEEYDGDTSYPDAALEVNAQCEVPLVVLANLPSALDVAAATQLRRAGIPVLEGTRSGLVALRNMLALAEPRPPADAPPIDAARRSRWRARLGDPRPFGGAESFELLAAYGLPVAAAQEASDEPGVLAAARVVGYPIVLKTDMPGVVHKSDVGGVVTGLTDDLALTAAYRDLAARLGPRVLVCAMAVRGVELAVGIAADRQLGPLIVVAAGGTDAELATDRSVTLPPVSRTHARGLLDRLRMRKALDGWRGEPAAGIEPIIDAIVAIGTLATELGDDLAALDVNPLIAGPSSVVAVDALIVPKVGSPHVPAE